MRNGYKSYATYPLALSLVAILAATGCGKKDKKDDAAAVAAAPDTWVTDTSVDGGTAKIKYKSNDANAKFKCQLEAEGQKDAAWNDCPAEGASLNVEPGVRYTFRVKAIGANGAEDKEPYSYQFSASGSSNTSAPTVGVSILNRDDVGETYDKSDLTLEFGPENDQGAKVTRYECKRENETSFRRCRDGDSYSFKDMKDGYTYSLAVRAVLENGVVSTEDQVTFRVEMSGLVIGGRDKLEGQVSGLINMTYPTGAECSMDGETAVPCAPAFAKINLSDSQVPQGNHTLIITIGEAGREEILFCARVCTGTGAQPAQPIIQDLQLGSFYTYVIPQGMHMTQYSTSKTTSDTMYWLRAMDDPLSNDLDDCLNNALPFPVKGREFSMLTPSGRTLRYCATTPNRAYYKEQTEHRRAINSMEVVTDIERVMAETGVRDERITFNVFDRETEFMVQDTTFQRLCSNRRGDIWETGPIRLINRDFYNDPVHASLMICQPDIVEFIQNPTTGIVQPVSAVWWVGSFFISSDGLDLPELRCMDSHQAGYDQGYCDGYWGRRTFAAQQSSCRNPSLVEVTLMIRQDSQYGSGPRRFISRREDFAAIAQTFFLENFHELVPVSN